MCFAAAVDQSVVHEDQDGDGLDDAWERTMFSSLKYGPNDDPDGDGLTNAQEALAGTDAMVKTSTLAIRSVERLADGSCLLKWPTVAGRHYRVEFTPALKTPTWTPIGNDLNATENSEMSTTIPAAGEGFYRIRLVE
jgi:hypothetical protein